MKALLVGNANRRLDCITAADLYPFFENRRKLKQLLGLSLRYVQATNLSEIDRACANAKEDIFFIRPSWRENADDVVQLIQKIRTEHPQTIIIFLDPWEQESSRFFGALPYVDRFVKQHGFSNLENYQKKYIGGTIVTDYLAKEWNVDTNDFDVSSLVPKQYEHRIVTAWNFGSSKRLKNFLKKSLRRQWFPPAKTIDIFCRVTIGSLRERDWYGIYRETAVKTIQQLEGQYQLAVSGEYEEHRTISSRQYFHDIERSRIVVSPFGWGMITSRDYEAVAYDCLLLKPSVECVETKPNIFIPGETYVPIRWDFRDLEEKCNYYLTHPEEMNRIVRNARRAYEDHFRTNEFVEIIRTLIQSSQATIAEKAISL